MSKKSKKIVLITAMITFIALVIILIILINIKRKKQPSGSFDTLTETDNEIEKSITLSDVYTSDALSGLAYTYWVSPQVISSGDNIFVGTVDRDGYSGVATINKKDSSKNKNVEIEQTDADNHDSTAIMIDPADDRLLCFIFEHDKRNYINVYKSAKEQSADKFEFISSIEFPNVVTYVQAFYYDERYYVFTRVGATSWYWAESYNLQEWNIHKLLITIDPTGEQQPVQYYIKFVSTLQENMLRMVMYSNPQSCDLAIRQGFFDLDTRIIYDGDGKTVIFPLDGKGAPYQTQFQILIDSPEYKNGEEYRQRVLDVASGLPLEDTRILYTYSQHVDMDAKQADIEYRMYENGETTFLEYGGSYLWNKMSVPNGGVITNDGDTVYISSRNIEEQTDNIYQFDYINGYYQKIPEPVWTYHTNQYEVEDAELYDRYRLGFLTRDTDSTVLVWLEGYFNGENYTDWNPRVNAAEIKK